MQVASPPYVHTLCSEATMEPLTGRTLAISVLRTYADRVRDRLLGIESEWVYLPAGATEDNPSTTCTTTTVTGRKRTRSPSCRVIPTRLVKGGRKNRRGFTVLILEDTVASLESLSPIVRQNVSATMELTHRITNATPIAEAGPILWSFLGRSKFDCFKHVLRVDCFPKEETEAICLGLQKAAAGNTTDDVKPFDGVVAMTPSASKCTHILHILLDSDVYWVGLVTSDSVVTKLNDNAARQVIIEPTDPATGEDISPIANPEAPVSRAYYKLDQAWNEVLAPIFACTDRATRGAAVDLGAAPGGWTQVLLDHFPLVVAVDQGVLAKRVAAMEGVKQLVAELSSEAVAETLKEAAPLSILVCDASTDSNEILDKIITLLQRLGKGCWSLPCAWVVTLKLPYKTVGSLERNLGKVVKTIPRHLQAAAEHAFDRRVSIKFKIAHLMANSDSERTIMAVFDDEHLQ